MGIPVRDLTFGGRGRAEHAPYPQMLTLATAIPRDPFYNLLVSQHFINRKPGSIARRENASRNG